MECTHPSMRCVSAFDSAKHLKFHLLDVHCPNFITEPNKLEMLKEEDDVESTRLKMRRGKVKKKLAWKRASKWNTASLTRRW